MTNVSKRRRSYRRAGCRLRRVLFPFSPEPALLITSRWKKLRPLPGPDILPKSGLNKRIIAGRFRKLNHQQSKPTVAMMLVVTVLNRCTKFKRFVFAASRFDNKNRIMVDVAPRKNSRPVCSHCGVAGSTYDTMPEPHLFEFIGCGASLFSLCTECGV